MKLGPGKWKIEITGDTVAFLAAGGRSREILTYQFERMVSGAEFSPAELEYWGLSIRDVTGEDEFVAIPRMD